jgi:hypothetical protein
MDSKTCVGEMQLTEGARKQIVVAVLSQHCKAGQLLKVYDRSRAGPGTPWAYSRSAAFRREARIMDNWRSAMVCSRADIALDIGLRAHLWKER